MTHSRTRRKSKLPCRYCADPRLPGGVPLCQFHWNVHHWGAEWARKCRNSNPKTDPVYKRKA
jgi:hypothetical protein